MQTDALVNCFMRQLESDMPGSAVHLHCFRVLCLGCSSGRATVLAGLCLLLLQGTFLSEMARAHFAGLAEGRLTPVVCPGAT